MIIKIINILLTFREKIKNVIVKFYLMLYIEHNFKVFIIVARLINYYLVIVFNEISRKNYPYFMFYNMALRGLLYLENFKK
jgi:hypothetical protein